MWSEGDRSVRCFLFPVDIVWLESMKDHGMFTEGT